MEEDKISVLMSIYKENENELKESIESILNQTYRNIEFIIVIDYPDEIWREKLAKAYNDSRIQVIVNEENMGLPKSLNKALHFATGNYIARMDADDVSKPYRLEKQLQYLKEKKLDLIGAYTECFRDNEVLGIMEYPIDGNDIKKILKYYSCISHPTWLGKKEIFLGLEGYRNIFTCEDYDFLIRAASKGFKLGNIPEILLRYRMTPVSISRSNLGKQKLINSYLADNYAKKHVITENDLKIFMNSKYFPKKLKKYINFYKYKAEKNNGFKFKIKYYLYLIYISLNFKRLIRFINGKISYKYVLNKQQKET